MIHLVVYFIARVPRTACGIYTSAARVTAFPEKATCLSCRRGLK